MKHSIPQTLAGAFALALLASAGTVAQAQISPHWIGSDGNFHSGSNWSSPVAPGPGDTAVFDDNAAAANYTIGFGGTHATVENALVTASSGLITLNIGDGVNWNITDTLQVGTGAGANPTLRLNTGTLTVGNLVVHSGATFDMNLGGIGGSTATLNTTAGSAITSNELQIAGFQRGFNWNISGGQNTVSNVVRIAFGSSSSATVNVDGAATTWNTGALYVGHNGLGALNVSGGAVVTNSLAQLAVNNSASAGSSATIEGPGSEWNLTGTLRLGQAFGDTSLSVSNGGSVSAADARLGEGGTASNNTALITGPGSSWNVAGSLTVGGAGSGNNVTISDGATLSTGNAFGSLGRDATSNSNSITVDDGSWTMGGEVSIGNRGSNNQLNILNGGVVGSATSVVIGSWDTASGNAATVSGSGSQWEITGGLTVGRDGSQNALQVTNGATVGAASLLLSDRATALENTAEVSGGATLNIGGNLTVGGSGSAAFTLAGGNVSAGNLLVEGSGNSFNFSAGQLTTSAATIDNGQAFVVGDGTQSATWRLAGAHLATSGVTISPNASLTGNGSIAGQVFSFGTLSPGQSTGSLLVDGSLSLGTSAVTVMELGGAGDFDEIFVTGNLTFDGALTVLLLGGYQPGAGDTFRLFHAGSTSGSFSELNLPALADGLSWNTDALHSLGDLSVIPEPSTAALLAGLTGLLFMLLRRKAAHRS